ncbi:MAG: lysophospholipase [Steroidobacteraceae bacterium]
MREDSFKGVGDLKIFFRSWAPGGRARAVLVIVHGFNSHSGQYRWVADRFQASGYAVYALDQRGRGRSEGDRFYIEKVADYVEDVATFVALAKSREPGLPVFVLGHSAGGVISCVYALEHQAQIAGLICESFAFKVPAPDLVLTILKGLSHFVPRLPVLKLPNAGFSRDPKVVESMNSDPLIAKEIQPAITVAALVRANERIKQEFPLIKLPVLILHGAADKVTLPAGSQFFHDTAGSADKTLKLYPDNVHDLLNDIGKEKVIADIMGWMSARLGAGS